ncbi:hypothetical protein TNCV_4277581 [Trichonephila clavipes]|nr:hypothetical protein TNCV_4277581 [Trichonephila clavipes]
MEHVKSYLPNVGGVGSLVFISLNSKLKGLGLMLNATEYVLFKSVDSNVLWAVEVETTGARAWRIVPSPPAPCLNCRVGDWWCRHPS